jgi:hypothetical protein
MQLSDEPEDRARRNWWLWLNLGAAGAIVAALVLFDFGIYLRFLRFGSLAAIVLLIAVPTLVWWVAQSATPESAKVIWASFAALLLLNLAAAAVMDAQQFQFHNCWVLNEQTEGSTRQATLECVPGSEPEQGEWFDDERGDGSYARCDFVDQTSSRGTIWRCEYGDV